MLNKTSIARQTLSGAVAMLIIASFTACTSHSSKTEYRNPASTNIQDGLDWLTPEENESLWGNYCTAKGGARSADVPTPNYKNAKVKKAVANFKKVVSNSLYPYPAILAAYGLREPSNVPSGVSKEAHVFLTYLCGEFRDRATMIEAKLKWLENFNKLKSGKQKGITADSKDNVWMQMTAETYAKFLSYSHDLWFARQAETPRVDMGSYNEEGAVDGLSVCATKFIFNEIASNRGFKDISSFKSSFGTYAGGCSAADQNDYYDFRGDSNFKPNSPEGNGMIWYANHIASNCKTTTQAKPAPTENVTNPRNIVTDETCRDYFTNPFRRRWQAARAGLSAWLLHTKEHDAAFADDGSTPIIIWPHRLTDDPATHGPFAYKVPKENGEMSAPLQDWLPSFDQDQHWRKNDFNFNEIAGLGTNKSDAGFAFERLRDAVNRHTNWYQSQWDDGLGGKNSYKTQAYSPFVASSYEPSESDQFTFCGITVPCPPDGFKHWMFVFRIKGKNWYRSNNVAKLGEPAQKVDFSYNWLDETSLGTTGLADKEHAWDRLGTALEDELANGAILYLHNITDAGEVSDDGLN